MYKYIKNEQQPQVMPFYGRKSVPLINLCICMYMFIEFKMSNVSRTGTIVYKKVKPQESKHVMMS